MEEGEAGRREMGRWVEEEEGEGREGRRRGRKGKGGESREEVGERMKRREGEGRRGTHSRVALSLSMQKSTCVLQCSFPCAEMLQGTER